MCIVCLFVHIQVYRNLYAEYFGCKSRKHSQKLVQTKLDSISCVLWTWSILKRLSYMCRLYHTTKSPLKTNKTIRANERLYGNSFKTIHQRLHCQCVFCFCSFVYAVKPRPFSFHFHIENIYIFKTIICIQCTSCRIYAYQKIQPKKKKTPNKPFQFSTTHFPLLWIGLR